MPTPRFRNRAGHDQGQIMVGKITPEEGPISEEGWWPWVGGRYLEERDPGLGNHGERKKSPKDWAVGPLPGRP